MGPETKPAGDGKDGGKGGDGKTGPGAAGVKCLFSRTPDLLFVLLPREVGKVPEFICSSPYEELADCTRPGRKCHFWGGRRRGTS